VTDYLAGMTDRFCIRTFERLSIPVAFSPEALAAEEVIQAPVGHLELGATGRAAGGLEVGV